MLLVKDFLIDQQVYRSPHAPQHPLVSVILPTYARYKTGQLQRAVESVLTQTFRDFELLIVDDGSGDGSREFIAECCRRDPRVVHIRHDKNCGLPGLRVNEGIELARGQYIAFQFDDDAWQPNALAALTAEAKQHENPAVIVGTVQLHHSEGKQLFPNSPVSLTTVYLENRIANNSVLVPREVFARLGMYDCHIAMRRLTDWDLWLRLIKYIPFHVLNEEIGDVYTGNADAIGMTVPFDLSVFRYIHDIPRARLLTPERWREYAVDTLRICEVELPATLARHVYQDHFLPYYLKFRHHFPQIEGFRPTAPRPIRNALFTRLHHDMTDDVSFHHYDSLAHRRQSYKVHFQVVTQLSDKWQHEADLLMLVRVVQPRGRELLQTALAANKPVAYYLDDDLLTFSEYGPQFAYIAPGAPDYRTVVELLQGVDAVWVTNEFIPQSVRPHNRRLIPHLGCTPSEWLPNPPPRRDPQRPLKIGYVGTNYRIDEFTLLWDALWQIAREFSERVTFEFWGLDISTLPPLKAPTKEVPFTPSYFEYLQRLQSHQFDILLVPLLDHPRPRLGKSLIKYYETAVAGALGIFSDVPQYTPLPDGQTCLKAKNTVDDWLRILRQALTMPHDEFDHLRAACIQHVRENYTSEAQIDKYEAAWRAVELHARTRTRRHADGRPRVLYAFHSPYLGGAELQLWHRARSVRQYGVEPVIVLPQALADTAEAQQLMQQLDAEHIQLEFAAYSCFDRPTSLTEFVSETERATVRDLLSRCRPALVHSATFIPTIGQVCHEMGIPHIASLYQVDEVVSRTSSSSFSQHCTLIHSDSIRYARRWAELLEHEWFCGKITSEECFSLGFTKSLTHDNDGKPSVADTPLRVVMAGTLQERKRQAEAITVIGKLSEEGVRCRLDLYGYTHFFPVYHRHCLDLIKKWKLQDQVTFHGFAAQHTTIFADADVLLCASTNESFPGSICEAMAAGVLVVTTPIGGVPELILDEQTGILCADTSVEALVDGIRRACRLSRTEYRRIVEAARSVARAEFHPNRAANDLFSMYLRALELSASSSTAQSAVGAITGDILPTSGNTEIVETVGSQPVAYEPVFGTHRYLLSPRLPHWSGVKVMISTPLASVTGRFGFRVYTKSGALIRSGEVPFDAAATPHWVRLSFPPIAQAAGQQFILALTLTEPRHTKLGVFETRHRRSRAHRAARIMRIAPVRDNLYVQMLYAKDG